MFTMYTRSQMRACTAWMTPLTVVTPLMAMLIVSASARSDLVVRKLAAVSEAGPARVLQYKREVTFSLL
jgi:hypothetical protein